METATEYDVLVFSNPSTDVALASMRLAKSVGKKVVVDFDDDPWHMEEAHPFRGPWDERERAFIEACLGEATLVTTTNSFLADFLTNFNERVRVLPNCLPGEYWDVPRKGHQKLVLGWVGGVTHPLDLELIATPVNRVLASRDDVELRLSIFEDNPFGPKNKVKMLPLTFELTEYPSIFAGLDVGLAPLVDNHFNNCKSDLRVLEYGAAGLPFVASNMGTYRRSVRDGRSGLLASSDDEWVEAINKLLDDAPLRAKMGAEARVFAEARFIDKNVGLWEKAYGL